MLYLHIHINHENILHLKLHSLMHYALTELEFYIAYTVNHKLEMNAQHWEQPGINSPIKGHMKDDKIII